MNKITLRVGVPLTQSDREFTPEITSILSEFAENNKIWDIWRLVQHIVSRITGKDKSFFWKFTLWANQKDIQSISEWEFLISAEQIWKEIMVNIKELIPTGGCWPIITVNH